MHTLDDRSLKGASQRSYREPAGLPPRRRIAVIVGALLVAVGAILPIAASAQSTSDCQSAVRSAFAAIGAIEGTARPCSVRYTTTTTYRRRNRTQTATTRTDLVVGPTRLHFRGPELERYVDASIGFVVLPRRRVIYVVDSDARDLNTSRRNVVGALRDSVLTHSRVVSCDKSGSGGARRVVLEPNGRTRSEMNIRRMEVELDKAGKSVRRVRIEYDQDSPILAIEVIIESMTLNDRAEAFEVPLRDMFLGSDGELLRKYAGYSLVDKRHRQ